MVTRARLALFASGVFFGGAFDHVVYMATASPRSHYGLQLTPLEQGVFGLFDMTVAAALVWLHVRWDRPARGGRRHASTSNGPGN